MTNSKTAGEKLAELKARLEKFGDYIPALTVKDTRTLISVIEKQRVALDTITHCNDGKVAQVFARRIAIDASLETDKMLEGL